MERDDRPTVATFFVDAAPRVGARRDARRSRGASRAREALEVGDRRAPRRRRGQRRQSARSSRSRKRRVRRRRSSASRRSPRPSPIHLRVPIGDRDRMLWLAEKATELGITTWQAVRFRRSASVSPRGEGAAFAEKVRARMVSALEQSGGAWLPAILPDVAPSRARARRRRCCRSLLDAAGEPLASIARSFRRGKSRDTRSGPRAASNRTERDDADRDAVGARCALGATTLRFETAGDRGARRRAAASTSLGRLTDG